LEYTARLFARRIPADTVAGSAAPPRYRRAARRPPPVRCVLPLIPLGRTGIGWFLAALAPAVGVGVVAHRSSVELSTPEAHPGRCGRFILALLAVLTFRNAWWLVTFCVIGALAARAWPSSADDPSGR